VTAVVWVGLRQTVQPLSSTPPASLRVALVQPSIPQQWIWSPAERARRFDQLLELSAQAMTNHPDLLVWPEAAAPGYVRWETNVYQPITNLVRSWHTWLILGGDDYVLKGDPKDPEAVDEFNSAFLVDPQGGFRATYRKRRLVIFGEFLPFHRWLPFLERWTGMGSFTPGREAVPFVIAEKKMRTFVLICFEDVFPHLTREYVDDDTDFLLNLTNNGWFGESAAQWQHAASAVFRAVENGVPLVRCANNGQTCFVDVHGRIWEEYFPGTTDIYGVGIKLVTVPLLDGKKRAPTFYRRYGDLFGWSCVAWSVLVAGRSLLRRRGDC